VSTRALSWFLQPAAQRPDEPSHPTAPAEVTSAAVLGRPGEAEPVAAALALALSRHAHTRAATVAVLAQPRPPDPATESVHPRAGGGWAPPSPHGESSPAARDWLAPTSDGGSSKEPSPAAGGSRAARRLVARLAAHGLPARARGRLAWVALPLTDGPAAARRAVVAGAPAVLAITAARTAELDEVLVEQDLVVLVAAAPGGPLARLAALPEGAPPLVVVRPLRRGPARSLACAGLAIPREIRALLGPDRRTS
jgi:hypothetical protein